MTLRVIQTVGWYFPEQSAGTEIYVDALARGLADQNIPCVIAAPRRGREEAQYDHNGVPVYRYPVFPGGSSAQERGYAAHAGFDVFARWLGRQKAAIYHQQSMTLGCSVEHLREARRLGLKTVLTLHLGGSVCLRGSMMLFGKQPCDGRIEAPRCGSCWGQDRGIPRPLADVISRIPSRAAERCESLAGDHRWATALATSSLVRRHLDRFLETTALADSIVVPCEWLRQALCANGVDERRICLSRQGVASPELVSSARGTSQGPLRIGFLGRCNRIKGVDLLIRAVRQIPRDIPVELALYALDDGSDASYRLEMEKLAGGDPRIEWKCPLPNARIGAAFQAMDVLAIPSRWMETGPLVLHEAFAAGVPVLGADRGAIAELLTPEVNGRLLPVDDPRPWSAAIQALAADRSLLERWRRGIPAPRTMKDVANEMAALYRRILS